MPVPPTPNQNYAPVAGNLHATGDGEAIPVGRLPSHTHAQANVTDLVSALAGKSALSGGNTFAGFQSITRIGEQLRLAHDETHYTAFTTDPDGGLVIACTGPDVIVENDLTVLTGAAADCKVRIAQANASYNAVLQMDSDGNATTFTVANTGALTIASIGVTVASDTLTLSPNGGGIVLKSPNGSQTLKLRLSNAGSLELVAP